MATEKEVKEKLMSKTRVVFLDECAAGVLCFDLFVCGVLISEKALNDKSLAGLRDSKLLTEKKRAELFPHIVSLADDFEIVRVSPEEVDQINIFQARMKGFRKAIHILNQRNTIDYAVIDGNKLPPDLPVDADCLIKADSILAGVSAASVLAKHSHTEAILNLSKDLPYSRYGLENHKGYGTKEHMNALKKYGPIPGFHRYSYKPVQAAAQVFDQPSSS